MVLWMAGLSVYAASATLCYTYWMRTARPEPEEATMPQVQVPTVWRKAAKPSPVKMKKREIRALSPWHPDLLYPYVSVELSCCAYPREAIWIKMPSTKAVANQAMAMPRV